MTKHLLLASLALTAVLAVVQPAEAAPIVTKTYDGVATTVSKLDPKTPAAPAELALDAASLEDISGEGANPIAIITDQTLTAITSGNSITAANVGSGAITLDRNAFSGFDGIGNFVINSGHNNTLQSSLNVSIVLAP